MAHPALRRRTARRPDVCGKSDIIVPADAGGDRRIAKFRQDNHYLAASWTATYEAIRSHDEGIHGCLKSSEIDIGNPKHRPAPDQVAQNLLVALMVTAGNLDILETWLYQRTGTGLTGTDYTADPPPTILGAKPPATPGQPPPAPGASCHARTSSQWRRNTPPAATHCRPPTRAPSNTSRNDKDPDRSS